MRSSFNCFTQRYRTLKVIMEALVRRYDFMTADYNARCDFGKRLEEISRDFQAMPNEQDMLGAFRVLRAGVCRPDFPGQFTEQCDFAKLVLHSLMTWSQNFAGAGMTTSMTKIHDFILDFLHDMLQQGPGTTHMELWTRLMNITTFGFSDYYYNLTGDKLKSHIRMFMREFWNSESNFETTFISAIRCLISKECFREQAFKEAQAEFVELYTYTTVTNLNLPEHIRNVHKYISDAISYIYDGDVLKGMDDSEMMKQSLKRHERDILRLSLTTKDSKKVVEKISSGLYVVLNGINNAFLFHKVYVEIMDFVTVICYKKAGSPIHPIVKAVGDFLYHVEEKEGTQTITGNSELFTGMTKKLIAFLNNLEDHTLMRVTFVDAAVGNVLTKSMNKSPEHCQLMMDLIKACLRIHQLETARAIYSAAKGIGKLLKWKEHVKDAREILDLLMKVRLFGSKEQTRQPAAFYINFASDFANQMQRDRILPDMVEKMVECSLTILERRETALFRVSYAMATFVCFNGKKHKGLIMSTLSTILMFLKDSAFPWDKGTSGSSNVAVCRLAELGMDALDAKTITEKDLSALSYFMKTVMKGDFVLDEEESNKPDTVFFALYGSLGTRFLRLLDDQEKTQRVILVVRESVNLLSSQHTGVSELALSQVSTLILNGARVMTPFFPQIMDLYMYTESPRLLPIVSAIYPYYPELEEKQFQALFELIETHDRSYVLPWFTQIAKNQPSLFTERNLKKLIAEMFEGDDKLYIMYLTIMDQLSKTMPKSFIPHLQTMMQDDMETQPHAKIQLFTLLKNVATRSEDQAAAEEVMAYLEKVLRGPEDELVTPFCLGAMRAIGGVYRPVLERRKPAIEDLRKRSTVQTTKDHCIFIVDVLEGRSMKSLIDDIKEMKGDIAKLDTRVTRTEVGLVLLHQDVDEQRMELDGVKVDVKKQGNKMVNLEKTVKKTKAKVEELDGKTLSHAPFWARDVAKLLNPEDLLDWTLLSSRLGYTNDDIRSWAQMHDPCMAMLNEWYATRKTREATYAVLTALQEIDRMDAAVIVENAMKRTEAVVEDEEFEYPEPPEVFISYQWGIQNEVKLLKQHLEKAGFTCWMDIGQMGGGDKLFEKIDKGIRAAKIVICCVTGKYAKSPNCNREVNLSVSLGKPIIPLLMEKLSWPPQGSMGPIFSEYLFIRFFTRPGEETGDIRYWSAAKFQELLMQVNYNNVKPEEQKVEKEYKNWWCPVAEVIKIEKKDVKAMTAASQQKQAEVERGSASPDIFISYQWGKQKQIQLMYKRLTEMGFTVWMDIYQMGGGDSLYDKIDKGVRGAKIVLTCVTSKYSLSANCRREVSLADALKKPIVPLLLEKMTWPPSGPMSMVFTQLLYINFGKDEAVQERWDGEKFDELLTSIDQYVPNIIILGKENTGSQSISQPPQPQRHQQQPQQQQPYQQPYQHQQVQPQRYPQYNQPQKSSSCIIL
ncbi:uncharacterized protein LOC124150107 [Haliotis rufescens]|uniref:uncharacterized protein LOC124150107 n=1 Tax=Haliotis rufescens TaxID=6454 RepID=UPI00201ED18B|nr:uncharacterized protein LOC124150107 [Haliotis rufescens]